MSAYKFTANNEHQPMSKQPNEEPAKRHMLEKWLSMRHVWNIPIYQRHYSWDSEDDAGQVQLFWNVVTEHAESHLRNDPKPAHYFGAILVNEQPRPSAPHAPRVFDVVDGQQRLTTIQLAMLALIHSVREYDDLAKRITDELCPYLYLDTEKNKPILQPTNYDNYQYHAVLFIARHRKADFPEVPGEEEAFAKSKVLRTFNFFRDEYIKFIKTYADANGGPTKVVDSLLDTLLHGFEIVLIQLRDTDRPQEVFQSLNTTSKPLTTLDLIRNDVFQRAADVKERTRYDQVVHDSKEWKTLEKPFWEEKIDARINTTHIEAYLPRMLIAKLPGENIKFERNAVVKTYRDKFVREGNQDILAEVIRMIDYEEIYRDLVERDVGYELPTIENPGVAKSFGIFAFSVWGNRDFWPAVFLVLKSNIPADEQQDILRLLESFVIRRHVSSYPTDNYNQFVPEVCAALSADLSRNSLKRLLLKSTSASLGFPKSEEIIAHRPEHNFIGQKNAKRLSTYVLQILARSMASDADEMSILNKLAIDHILPKSWHTDPEWKAKFLSDGEDLTSENARKVNNQLNAIGNLTLLSTKRNSQKSNRPFSETRKLLNESPLMMNRKIASEHTTWDLQAIEKRGADLVDRIRIIWPHPDEE